MQPLNKLLSYKILKLVLFRFLFLFVWICSMPGLVAQIHPDALKDWKNNKYSMFIHWGLYAELGGVWNGKQVTYGLSEQIQAHAGIYSDVYEQIAKRFNPLEWDADEIALLAKNAGMRSIVMTSKHHDGFCMYHSQYTDFNIVDATPFKRDVLKELADACQKHGLKFGLYYSNIDWHYPQAAPISHHNSDVITPEHFEYNQKQIEELLTHYGPVSELWFDMGSYSLDQSSELRKLVHEIQPDCMIGSRLGNDRGDFMIMGDNQEPDYIIGVPWQSPASFFPETWGYRSWQERVPEAEKVREKLTSLVRVVSRGGNYLLNIGLRGDGSVVEYEQQVLLSIGEWLKKYGEAIYDTQADPFHVAFNWGYITSKSGKIYLNVFSIPENRTIMLPGIKGTMLNVKSVGENIICPYQMEDTGLVIRLPDHFNLKQEVAKVIEVSFDGDFITPPINLMVLDEKKTVLNQHNAFKYYSNSGIDYNTRFQSVIREAWTLQVSENQTVVPVLYYTEEEKDRSVDLQFGEQKHVLTLNRGVQMSINKEPDKLNWSPLYLQGPLAEGMNMTPDSRKTVDITQPWGKHQTAWKLMSWKNDSVYSLPAGMSESYYVFQEINSPSDQSVLISLVSGDGVCVALNGKMLLLHNNPLKKDQMKDVVLLSLKKGKNQLLVKFFNNFKKTMPLGIGRQVPQLIYRQTLPEIQLQKDRFYPVSWQLSQPTTPHETLNLPNLSLGFQ